MTSPSETLASLGLTLPAVAAPVGTYVPALVHDGLVHSSGQLPLSDGSLLATGLVGERTEDVTPERARDCARQSALNALAAVAQAAGGLDNIASILKVTGFVASAPGFTAQPAVINGASDLMVEVFGDAGRHARSAVGVAALPMGAPVEVEIVVALRAS